MMTTNDNPLRQELRDKIDSRYSSLYNAFLAIDTDRSGFISRQKLRDVRLSQLFFELAERLHLGMLHVGLIYYR
jgi:Ca2+-binding EF-hand superfamily protein